MGARENQTGSTPKNILKAIHSHFLYPDGWDKYRKNLTIGLPSDGYVSWNVKVGDPLISSPGLAMIIG